MKKKEIKTIDVTIVLDRSGSMACLKDEMPASFDTFIKDQKKSLKGKDATYSLFQFDDKYDTVYENLPITKVPKLVLEPRGNTALLDAIGKTITSMDERYKKAKKSPDLTILVILTDGAENASQEYTNDQVAKLIKEKKTKGWEVVFLAATLETKNYAVNTLGIKASNVLRGAYGMGGVQGAQGAQGAMGSLSAAISLNASGKSFAFSVKDRKLQDDLLKGNK